MTRLWRGSVRRDVDHDRVSAREYCVRDVDEPDLGIRMHNMADVESHVYAGVGDLFSAASDQIENRIDLEEHVGETVATVYADLDAWEYAIDWHVDPPLKQRLRELVPGASST